MGRIVKKKFTNVTVTSSGLELGTLIPKGYNRIDGYIKQVVFYQVSGWATELSSIEIRYFPGDSTPTNLIYKSTSSALSMNQYSDSYIDAPFSIDNVTDSDQLVLYLQTDAAGTFDIRIDLEILGP